MGEVHGKKREKRYTKTVGIRLETELADAIVAAAGAAGKSAGEWKREAFLEKLNRGATLDMVFAEVVMFRKLFQEMQGKKWREGQFTVEDLLAEVDKKDARRAAWAAERILEYRQQA